MGLVEVYDLAQAANSKLANISTRGFVDAGNNVMIGGSIVGGGTGGGSAKVILRALGQSVPVAGALGDPTLELHDASGITIATNDNWKINDQTGQSQEADIRATTIPPINELESALVVTLAPVLPGCSRKISDRRLTSVDRAILDKAQWILPRVLRVEGPLAPGTNYDAAARRVMDFLTRETM